MSRCIDSQAFAPDTTSRRVPTPCTPARRYSPLTRTNHTPVGCAVRGFRAPDTHDMPLPPMMDNPAHAERQEAEPAEAETRAGADIIYLPDERQRTKKITSGSNKRKRQHLEQFRTDDAERDALREQLRATGLSLGEYVMQLAKIAGGKEARPRRRGRAAFDAVALTQAVVAFNRAGNNQNQIARSLNELLQIAREQSNARLESLVSELAEAVRGIPDLFAEPVAAIMAALDDDSEG
jgi:hypothetical protein